MMVRVGDVWSGGAQDGSVRLARTSPEPNGGPSPLKKRARRERGREGRAKEGGRDRRFPYPMYSSDSRGLFADLFVSGCFLSVRFPGGIYINLVLFDLDGL